MNASESDTTPFEKNLMTKYAFLISVWHSKLQFWITEIEFWIIRFSRMNSQIQRAKFDHFMKIKHSKYHKARAKRAKLEIVLYEYISSKIYVWQRSTPSMASHDWWWMMLLYASSASRSRFLVFHIHFHSYSKSLCLILIFAWSPNYYECHK